MTNAQMDVLTARLDAIEKHQLRIEATQAKQNELLTAIANNKVDVDSLKVSIEALEIAVDSIKDEVNA